MEKELIVCGINNPQRDKLFEEYKIEKDKEIYCSFIFLHGKLERIVGHDQIDILNPDDFNVKEDIKRTSCGSSVTLRWLDETGIFDCKVIGVDELCVAYVWTTESYNIDYCRGFICLKSDKDAIQYAEKKYNEKFSWFKNKK